MSRPSPALVLSCIAVFLSAAGGAVAAGQINGKQIKNGSVTGKDIKNDSLTGTDIKGHIRGPKGPPGLRGPQGLAGPAGSGGVNVSYQFGEATISTDGLTTVDALCPAGQVAVGGGFNVTPPVTVRSSLPNDEGGRKGGSWTVLFEVQGDPPTPIAVSAFAVCASGIGPPGPA